MMTEQPVEPATEQVWLGNRAVPLPEVPKEHYAPNAHRIPQGVLAVGTTAADANFQRKVEGQRFPLDLQAEIHAGNAVQSFQDGELDEGIAWLQSALAFAQNYRHARAEEAAR